jgi:DNA-binding Lrp family transcriptional regulator
LDRLDFSILKAMLVNNGVPPGVPVLRKSFRSMARDLKVDQATVRARMKKFRANHVLRGWTLGVNPGIRGQRVGQVWLGVRETEKVEVTGALLSANEVERVCNYFGPLLSFVYLFDEGANPDQITERLLRKLRPRITVLREGVIPVPRLDLKDTDESIIRSLGSDPWKPYLKVAEEVRTSSRTVARRVARLSEQGAIYLLPVVDLKALGGIIPAELVVEYSPSGSKKIANEQIAGHIGGSLVFSDVSGPYGYFALLVENLSQLERIAEWSKEVVGVMGARVAALQDVILSPRYYQGQN